MATKIEPPADLPDGEILEAVRKGAAWSRSVFGDVAVPFGRYFRVGRKGGDRSWPVGGGSLQDVAMATPRAISFAPARDGKQMIGHTGQSSTQVVIMTRSPRVVCDHSARRERPQGQRPLGRPGREAFQQGTGLAHLLPAAGRADEARDVQEGAESVAGTVTP